MADLPPKLQEFVKNSRDLDKMTRNMYLLDFANKLGDYPEDEMTDDHKVRGCTSTVYITSRYEDGGMQYKGWSDAQIVQGMVSVLVNGLSGESPDTIVQLEPDFIKESGISDVLTSTRQGGFVNIFKRLKREAAPHASTSESVGSASQ